MVKLSANVLGYPITVLANQAGSDWNVFVTGGRSPHVGSVSFAEFQGGSVKLRTLLRDKHKDQIIGDRFAEKLSKSFQCTVCVSCGIHYDAPSRTDLEKIVTCANDLLEELCKQIAQNSGKSAVK